MLHILRSTSKEEYFTHQRVKGHCDISTRWTNLLPLPSPLLACVKILSVEWRIGPRWRFQTFTPFGGHFARKGWWCSHRAINQRLWWQSCKLVHSAGLAICHDCVFSILPLELPWQQAGMQTKLSKYAPISCPTWRVQVSWQGCELNKYRPFTK